MRILIDAHPVSGQASGIGRYCNNLIKALKTVNNSSDEILLYTNEKKNKLPREYSKFRHFYFPYRNGFIRNLIGLNLAILKLKPDVVHCHHFAPLIKLSKIIITVHDVCFKEYPTKFPFKTFLMFKLFFLYSIHISDLIIVSSQTSKKQLIKYYDIDPKKIVVTPLAADPIFSFINLRKKVKEDLKDKFGIKNKYFLVSGELQPRKKNSLTIEAFEKISSDYPEVDLVFVGPNKGSLSSFDFKNSRIKYLGYLKDNDLKLIYNGAEALIYNSYCEGFGLPIIEAMKCKTPVIASNLTVFKEVFNDSIAYFRTTSDLSKLMKAFLKNSLLCKEYIFKSFSKSKEYSWEQTAIKTLYAYKKLLGVGIS